MSITEIWHYFKEACNGMFPVYELAHSCQNLPEETIKELADKIWADTHNQRFDSKKYKKFINAQNYKQRITKLEV